MPLKTSWHCSCNATFPGDLLMVVANHDRVGNWNPQNSVVLSTDASSFPTWRSGEVCFDEQQPVRLEYKLIIRRASGEIYWEPIPTNRVVTLTANTSSVIENVWGSLATCSITFFPLQPIPSPSFYKHAERTKKEASSVHLHSASISDDSGSDTGTCSQVDESRTQRNVRGQPASVGTGKATAAERGGKGYVMPHHQCSTSQRRHSISTQAADEAAGGGNRVSFKRSAFILANTGPITNYYTVSKTIGRGTWGEVKLVIDNGTGARRAAKKIPKCYVEDADRFRQEIEIMKSLDHPNIVRLYETFEDMTDFYLVMEYCTGGELFDRLVHQGVFTEALACRIMRQILAAVAYCHAHRVAHRDLKPENFLFLHDNPESPIKLIDFGLAARFKSGQPMRTRAGTPYYVSPQVLEGRYGPECDVWSAGVMMYILLCGYPPFNAPSDRAIMNKVRAGHYTFPDSEWSRVSLQAKDLISRLLDRHPRTRISAEQALRHAWFAMHAPGDHFEPLGLDILSKFRRFQGLSRLKKLALTVIAQHLEDSEIEGLKNLFTQLDTEGDGVLTVEEIRKGIERSGVHLPPDMVLEDVLREVDTAGTGSIDYTEFIAACLHQSHYIREEACRAAFRVLDINGDGLVSAQELRQVFHMAGDLETDAAAELLEADADGDGHITFDEFCGLMRKVPSLALVTEHTVSMMRRTCSRTNISEASLTPRATG
ncbi:calcium-dependent protein kinase CDPK2 [Toxoplasma gondii ME49]|uniref:non-specific serine/threonine protein kinase n=1 Tax=Toxoplasma gondii (strain ATCC 50611 / Me49) TaxID=508771 RepID=S8EXE8_TOXGM|nr:calcium-dependent protein kinase CDPK2 [Toxoplasma gondii ME49]EPT27057.1 calcium-dependent protein kinase CDPK2 [Toxoplasma gondii ME49]|eukprot:XP_002366222.1 calcium-dependent protein kinase CDPK2 [Toxoplasma gondii ME49]